MTFVGIDLGSRFVKIIVETDGKVTYQLIDTVEFYQKNVRRIDDKLTIDLSFLPFKVDGITATGYGRNLLNFANVNVISEIKAHFKGAVYQTGENNFILIDIGGQDSKVIIVKDGYIEDFVMNDKCAASSGRFIEAAANILKIPIEKIGSYTENPVKLSSTCSVFAESEIIGKIAEGYPLEEIASGVNESIARRVLPYIKKYTRHKIFVGGGVSLFKGVIYFIEQHLNKKVEVLPNPQFNGAIGCLMYSKMKGE